MFNILKEYEMEKMLLREHLKKNKQGKEARSGFVWILLG